MSDTTESTYKLVYKRGNDILRRMHETGGTDDDILVEFYEVFEGFVQYMVNKHLFFNNGTVDRELLCMKIMGQIANSIDSYDPERNSAVAWVATITKRRCIDEIRKYYGQKKNRSKYLDGFSESDMEYRDEYTDRNQAEINTMMICLGELPDQTQEVIRMHYVSNMTVGNIHDATGYPEGTIKTHLRRGRMMLQRLMETRKYSQMVNGESDERDD